MKRMNALEKQLVTSIRARGPISIASWMREALTHPLHGYYMSKDVFGSAGDFTTAPEASPLFCRVVASWVAERWTAMGRPRGVKLVELGPGRGTLMLGVVESLVREGAFDGAAGMSVHLMEASAFLQQVQRERLAPLGVPCHWHTSISAVPEEGPFLFVAHEFFDALPVFRFHWRPDRRSWCEELVDVDDDPSSTGVLRFVLSPEPTPATVACLGGQPKRAPLAGEPVVREVSPDSHAVMEVVARRMAAHPPSAALIVDYGSRTAPTSTLRAIHKHAFVPLLLDSGNCDLSADVDFSALERVAQRMGVASTGVVSQREFLEHNGIDVLLLKSLRAARTDQECAALVDGFDRVVNRMGTAYHVMALSSSFAALT